MSGTVNSNSESTQQSIDRNTAYEGDIALLEREVERLGAAFKNFHRLLCERFDYGHDEKELAPILEAIEQLYTNPAKVFDV